ncbi:thiamine phosphate synthase [Opitutales bacterium ASA1]|uniref:thiamine phosphate synthase n=1 Tax=Congregicoccus parvus TaxID=3081749 RepID=UPI002B30B0FA|nr:thiamine phosphate synthase [Opitutales bacterium ASA1]
MSLEHARFYAILDTGYVSPERWVATCEALLSGGADLVQIRAKRETPAQREALLTVVLPVFARARRDRPPHVPALIVNDDLELCLRHPDVGLHIGQDDTPPHVARAALGPNRLLGLSTHSLEQASAALALAPGVLDYFAVGPVFATRTKPDYRPVGLELVSRVAALRPHLPWFAIGGIHRGNTHEVVAAGARRIVVVSDVLTASDPAAAVRTLRTQIREDSR